MDLRAVPFEKFEGGMSYPLKKFHRGWVKEECDSIGAWSIFLVILWRGGLAGTLWRAQVSL